MLSSHQLYLPPPLRHITLLGTVFQSSEDAVQLIPFTVTRILKPLSRLLHLSLTLLTLTRRLETIHV